MTKNLVEFPGSPTVVENEPVAEVVKTLENLLERARSGEIQALAYAVVVEGNACAAWTTEGTERCKFNLMTAVAILNHRILADAIEYGTK